MYYTGENLGREVQCCVIIVQNVQLFNIITGA